MLNWVILNQKQTDCYITEDIKLWWKFPKTKWFVTFCWLMFIYNFIASQMWLLGHVLALLIGEYIPAVDAVFTTYGYCGHIVFT